MEKVETRGRKPKDTVVRERKITIKVSEEEMERMEKLAEYMEIPKTVAVRNMALFGLEEAEAMRRLGILSISKGLVKTSDWLEKIMKAKAIKKEK